MNLLFSKIVNLAVFAAFLLGGCSEGKIDRRSESIYAKGILKPEDKPLTTDTYPDDPRFKLLQDFISTTDHTKNVFVVVIRALTKTGAGTTMQDFENKLGTDLSLPNIAHQYQKSDLAVSQFVECTDNDIDGGAESKISNATKVFDASIRGQTTSDTHVNNECSGIKQLRDAIPPQTVLEVVFEFNRSIGLLTQNFSIPGNANVDLTVTNDVQAWANLLKQEVPNIAAVRMHCICAPGELGNWQKVNSVTSGLAVDFNTVTHKNVFESFAVSLVEGEPQRGFDISKSLEATTADNLIFLLNDILLVAERDYVVFDKTLRLKHPIKLKKDDKLKVGFID